MTILPLPGQVLVEILPAESKSIGGITIPDGVEVMDKGGKLPPEKGKVVRLGRWPQKPNGKAVLPEFSPGDTVLVSRYSGQRLKHLDDKFRLVQLDDVLAVLT